MSSIFIILWVMFLCKYVWSSLCIFVGEVNKISLCVNNFLILLVFCMFSFVFIFVVLLVLS